MRLIRISGILVVAVFVLNAMAVASASAHLFHASGAGTILDVNLNTHKFKTNAGTVECTTETSVGTVKAGELLGLHSLEEVNYSNCEVTGLFLKATVSKALYLFSADGLVAIQNTITVNAGSGACIITVHPQDIASGVTYANNGTEMELKANVSAIKYLQSGPLCVTETPSNGTYEGNSLVTLDLAAGGKGAINWL